MPEPLRCYDANAADNPPWIKAPAQIRRLVSSAWRLVLPAVPAIIVSIDQYAESALGNRNHFLYRPYGIGKGDIPESGEIARCNV